MSKHKRNIAPSEDVLYEDTTCPSCGSEDFFVDSECIKLVHLDNQTTVKSYWKFDCSYCGKNYSGEDVIKHHKEADDDV